MKFIQNNANTIYVVFMIPAMLFLINTVWDIKINSAQTQIILKYHEDRLNKAEAEIKILQWHHGPPEEPKKTPTMPKTGLLKKQ